MPRVKAQERDPARYERIKEAQKELENEYSNHTTIARLCPYCGNKVEILYRGAHGATHSKCNACGESVFFPPVVFRIAG